MARENGVAAFVLAARWVFHLHRVRHRVLQLVAPPLRRLDGDDRSSSFCTNSINLATTNIVPPTAAVLTSTDASSMGWLWLYLRTNVCESVFTVSGENILDLQVEERLFPDGFATRTRSSSTAVFVLPPFANASLQHTPAKHSHAHSGPSAQIRPSCAVSLWTLRVQRGGRRSHTPSGCFFELFAGKDEDLV